MVKKELFVDPWRDLGREIFKKNPGPIGQIEIENRNPFSEGNNGSLWLIRKYHA